MVHGGAQSLFAVCRFEGEWDRRGRLDGSGGIRTVRTEGRRILINGRPVLIKGFCRHEDHPQFGCALPYEAMDYDLNVMLHLGANSVRTSHYPNDEIFLDLCDEKGILVWEENHAGACRRNRCAIPILTGSVRSAIGRWLPLISTIPPFTSGAAQRMRG